MSSGSAGAAISTLQHVRDAEYSPQGYMEKVMRLPGFPVLVVPLLLAACARPDPVTSVSAGPDCRPMAASVTLQCWYGGKDAPMSQCSVGRESPPGCDIGPAAIAYFHSGLDLTAIFHDPAVSPVPRPRWVQFNVYRDADGRVGRKYGRDGVERLYDERKFRPQ